MKILMFGWEFPPFSHGGLGKACHGLLRSLAKHGTEITLVAPLLPENNLEKSIKTISTFGIEKVKMKSVICSLSPYETPSEYYKNYLKQNKSNKKYIYSKNLFEEVNLFTEKAALISSFEDFDIVHAHDWMTFGAGIKVKELSKKPLIVHIHSTEFDRTGGNGVNQNIYNIEKHALETADHVITVSNLEKDNIVRDYGIAPEKITVLYNAINSHEYNNSGHTLDMNKHYKIVLFLGRVTIQKGPDYFLYAAKKVLELNKDVVFIVAGSGDMEYNLIEKAADLGISDRFFLTGYLNDKRVEHLMKSADVLVMPSVSEPFGIVALEAMINKVPLIISKQSGVIEVVRHCIKVDFWDVNEMANKILALLEYNSLSDIIKENGFLDVHEMNWDNTAKSCMNLYENMMEAL